MSDRTGDLQLLTTREVTALLKLDRSTLWDWTRKGRFPKPIKLGRATRYRRSDIEAWLASRPNNLDG